MLGAEQKACSKRAQILITKSAALKDVSKCSVYRWMLKDRSRDGVATPSDMLAECSL